MRNTYLYGTSLLACLALSACSGDDGGKTQLADAAIDSPKQMDAPAAVCTIPASLPAGQMVGTMAAPVADNFVAKNMMGTILFRLPIATTMDRKNGVSFIVPRPATGFVPGTFAFEPLTATMPKAVAFMSGNITNGMAEKTLAATNGSITLTSIGQTAGASIKGTVASTTFKEIDASGNQVAGGCASTLGGLSFFLTQMTLVERNVDGTTTPETWKFQIEGQQPQFLTVE